MLWQVYYRRAGETSVRTYLGTPTTREEAEKYAQDFTRKYVGKPFPNGKGWYPVSSPWVDPEGTW